jgi:hypothetical protein
MTTLTIDLQDGFTNDTVTITMNAQVVYDNNQVTTNDTIGLADSVTADSDDELVDLEIALADKQLTSKTRLNPVATPYIGVSKSDSQLMIKLSAQAFLYF